MEGCREATQNRAEAAHPQSQSQRPGSGKHSADESLAVTLGDEVETGLAAWQL